MLGEQQQQLEQHGDACGIVRAARSSGSLCFMKFSSQKQEVMFGWEKQRGLLMGE